MLHKGDKEDCPICNPKDHTAECAKILKMPPAEVEWLKKIEIEEADPKCEHKNLGLLALGGTQRCLDCHEWIIAKPFTQCPECHGTKYINRVVSCADWELHPIYVIATCLNCKGEGVI
jgi:DnaJ-class molecular chaperone